METVNVLGTEYTIEYLDRKDDLALEDLNGYCDTTSKRIVVCNYDYEGPTAYDKPIIYQNQVLKHEIIHAFFYESGLSKYEKDEDLVEWIALQATKIFDSFTALGNVL